MTTYDVVIVGAGPAGATTAIALHNSGLRVALIDKSMFPRDKICGDALSPDVINQLGMLPLDTRELFDQFEKKTWCNAVRFVAPNYSHADLKLNKSDVSGYVSPRLDFDLFLFNQALKSNVVDDLTGNSVKSLVSSPEGIDIELSSSKTLRCSMVLGADGAHSVVSRFLSNNKVDKYHYCAGLRQYYENVDGFSDDNAVELHFYNEMLPGYFWIFPLPNNRANVGLGMLSAFVSKKNLNLKTLLSEFIATHPNVKERFRNAKPLEEIKGFGLPLGSKKQKISGNRFLLLGDAASLINPLSGEGIANAIRSGRVAADHIRDNFKAQRFDESFNQAYDREIYRRMWGELRLNYWIQIAMRNPRICNLIVRHAIGNRHIQNLVLSGFNPSHLKPSIFKS